MFIVTRAVLMTKKMVVTQHHLMPGLAIHTQTLFTHKRTHIHTSAFLLNRIPDILCFQSSIFPGATVTCHFRARPKCRVVPRIAVTLQSINPSITALLLCKPMANSMIYRATTRKGPISFLTLEGTERSAIRSSILLCRVVDSLFVCVALLML